MKMTKNEIKRKQLSCRIVETATEMVKSRGYDQTTMEGIAKACEITKRTLYKYYPVKEAIFADYVKMMFAEQHAVRSEAFEAMTSTSERVDYYMKALMSGVLREPVIFEHYIVYVMRMLVSYRETGERGSGVSVLIEQIITSGRAEGVIDFEMPDGMIADLFLFVFVEMTKQYYTAPEKFDIDTACKYSVAMFMKAIAPDKT
ncbi:TetR/AcrR family transcriptional regulator [Fusibacter paucivorans]|uniref:TetR/AcrR family transcriptional regulator n=1 Tax=Fusibacter paucivorans TaxID=76009 RepID=A0ABS5PQM4_9FIRM|nr:TetR/AcrR family transcriptional regulator [Fusibacter paucivorans]MBS7526352.1 TetR/AcrR family transcriptional regulator [Fusibacter paucivorans]